MSLTISHNIMNNINLYHVFFVMADIRMIAVADAGFKERGGCSGGGSPKGGGCGRGMCPLPREARKLLKTLIRCAKMHEKITSFFYLCRILRIM